MSQKIIILYSNHHKSSPIPKSKEEKGEGKSKMRGKTGKKKDTSMHSLLRHRFAVKMVLVFFDNILEVGI